MNANRKMLSNDFGKTSTSLSNVVLYSQPSPSPSCRQTNKVSELSSTQKNEIVRKMDGHQSVGNGMIPKPGPNPTQN